MPEIQPVPRSFPAVSPDNKQRNTAADPHLPVAAAARALRISPTTLRRYIKDYGEHVDVVRDGHKLMVAVSSVPTLARIRDLRARGFRRAQIGLLLAAPADLALPADLADSIEAAVSAAVRVAFDAAEKDLRRELSAIKQTSRDNDVVVRQSLANILFLIDKFSKELQFHLSEERIASNERDLRLLNDEDDLDRRPDQGKAERRPLASAAAFCRRLLAGAFSR